MSEAERFAAELAALNAEYRAKLALRLAALDVLAMELASGPADNARLNDLRRELHTIAGSARTFGLPAVTDAARAAERFLEPWCGPGRPPGAGEWATVKTLLAALREAAHADA